MSKRTRFIMLCIVVLIPVNAALAADFPVVPAFPAPHTIATITPSTPADKEGADVVLLIDSSGSMKRTDPKDYRKAAAKLFLSLLGKEDRIGVVSFGDAATILSPLTRSSEQNRPALFRAVDRISSREFSTNITDAVQKGFDALKTSPKQNRILLMMSDGKLALGSPVKDAIAGERLNKLLPELAKETIRMYTVAFTDEADRALLENMARETGGSFRFAKEDKDVHLMFASIFENIKSPDSVPFEGESFPIDNEIREATVLVTKKAGTALILTDPADRQNTASSHAGNITWFESPVFDMITIETPVPGKWRVKLSINEGNKVYIVTNLSLRVSLDGSTVNKGADVGIKAWLEKQGGIVTEKDILENTTFSASITGPDGKTTLVDLKTSITATLAGAEASGKYAAAFTVPAVGDYSLAIRASGKTFEREKNLSFRAVEPPTASTAEPKPEPPPQPVSEAEPAGETVSWGMVLLKLGIINLAVAVVAAAAYVLRKKISLKRKAP